MSVVPASWGPQCTWPVPRRGLCHVGAPCPWLRPSAPPPSLQLLPPQGHPWTPFPPSTEPRSFLVAPSQGGPSCPGRSGPQTRAGRVEPRASCRQPGTWCLVNVSFLSHFVSRCLALLSHLPPRARGPPTQFTVSRVSCARASPASAGRHLGRKVPQERQAQASKGFKSWFLKRFSLSFSFGHAAWLAGS